MKAWSDQVVEDGDVLVKELGNSVDSQTVKDNSMPMKQEVKGVVKKHLNNDFHFCHISASSHWINKNVVSNTQS